MTTKIDSFTTEELFLIKDGLYFANKTLEKKEIDDLLLKIHELCSEAIDRNEF